MPRKTKNETRLIFYNKYNRHLYNSKGWTTDKPDMAEKGQGTTMAEMIRKFTRGEIPPLAKSAFHGYNIDEENFEGSRHPEDLAEVGQAAQELERSRLARENLVKSEANTASSGAESPQAKDATRTRQAPTQEAQADTTQNSTTQSE